MKKTTLKINGMMCGMCEAHVKDVIRRNFDAKKITASHIKNQAVVISKEPLDKEKLKSVIGETGYVVEEISEEDYSGFSLFTKSK